MAINTGVNISKTVGFAVVDIPAGVDISKAVAFAVLQTAAAPIWPSFTVPSGVQGFPYSVTWDLYPASAPTTYSVVSGSLPPGLSLSSISADLGSISGTPTTPGSFTFTLRATNAYGFSDKSFSISIVAMGGGSFMFIS